MRKISNQASNVNQYVKSQHTKFHGHWIIFEHFMIERMKQCHICTHDQSIQHKSNSRRDKIMKSTPKNKGHSKDHLAKRMELFG
jgi:hypothetical protein